MFRFNLLKKSVGGKFIKQTSFVGGLFILGVLAGIFVGSPPEKPSQAVETKVTVSKSNFPKAPLPEEKEKLPATEVQSPTQVFKVSVPIVLYHYIGYNNDSKDTLRTKMTVGTDVFKEQMKYLAENDYKTLTLDDLRLALTNRQEIPKKSLILTFDDGYRDFYTNAFPVLKKYRLKAINFVPAEHLNRSGNLTDSQLKEISDSKIVEIGAHTLNHVYLKGLEKNKAWREISESKRVLEAKTGRPVKYFAYPYGVFSSETIEMVKKAGFLGAVSTIKGIEHQSDSLYILKRTRVGNSLKEEFKKKLEGK